MNSRIVLIFDDLGEKNKKLGFKWSGLDPFLLKNKKFFAP